MLLNAIGALLPTAVGVALSPIPIIAVVVVLTTSKARTNGPAFAIGWVAGLVVVATVVLLVAGSTSTSTTDDGASTLKVAIGILFLVMARRQWAKRPAPGQEAEMPKWLATVDELTPPKALVLGAALSGINPKNLALTAAAAATIAQAELTGLQDAEAIAIFVILGSVTVVGPVLAYLVKADAAAPKLANLKVFMAGHSNVIMMVVLLVLGAKFLGEGLALFN